MRKSYMQFFLFLMLLLLSSCWSQTSLMDVSASTSQGLQCPRLNMELPKEVDNLPCSTGLNYLQNSVKFPKIIWTFWDKGIDHMPAFNRYNVGKWRQIVGSQWDVVVVSLNPSDACYYTRFIEPSFLPSNFLDLENFISPNDITKTAVVQSDHIRLALLEKYGGIWMDSSNVLYRHPENMFIREIFAEDGIKSLAGYINLNQSTEATDHLDGFENWFIAARKQSAVIHAWRKSFIEYWETKQYGQDVDDHPMYKDKIDFSYIPKDNRNYLSQHAAFGYILQAHPEFAAQILAKPAKGPFSFASRLHWNANRIYQAVVNPKYFQAILSLYQNDPVEFYKFPSGQLKSIHKNLADVSLFYKCDNVFEFLYNSVDVRKDLP